MKAGTISRIRRSGVCDVKGAEWHTNGPAAGCPECSKVLGLVEVDHKTDYYSGAAERADDFEAARLSESDEVIAELARMGYSDILLAPTVKVWEARRNVKKAAATPPAETASAVVDSSVSDDVFTRLAYVDSMESSGKLTKTAARKLRSQLIG